MGHHNDFVTGEQTWALCNKGPSRDPVKAVKLYNTGNFQTKSDEVSDSVIIYINKRSRIYHLSTCPSYKTMEISNIVEFKDEEEALNSGYRESKNCP
jgi:deoxyribonuclease-1